MLKFGMSKQLASAPSTAPFYQSGKSFSVSFPRKVTCRALILSLLLTAVLPAFCTFLALACFAPSPA